MTDRQDQRLRPEQDDRDRSEDEARRDEDIAREYGEDPVGDLPGALGEEAQETDDLEGGRPGRSEQAEEPIEGSREFEEDGVENQ
jgi:hypothetical protein